VVIEYPRKGAYALAFETGEIATADGRLLKKLFIPTTPNPTSGFLEFYDADEVIDAGLTVEEAVKMIVSGGLLCPPGYQLICPARETDQSSGLANRE
jgi:uncharacterized membrane protein